MKNQRFSVAELRRLLRYDAETGRFFWLIAPSRALKVGEEAAANSNDKGYRGIKFKQGFVQAQRLAWALHHGVWPEGRVTFRDGDIANCRISNLALHKGIKGYDSRTSEGRSAYGKAWRAANPDRAKERDLKKNFGLTLAEYSAMHLAQNGVCAICAKPETETRLGKLRALAVDHNHETGTVRDLLCTSCNKLIGLANENRDILIAAARYLDKHAGRKVVVAFAPVERA